MRAAIAFGSKPMRVATSTNGVSLGPLCRWQVLRIALSQPAVGHKKKSHLTKTGEGSPPDRTPWPRKWRVATVNGSTTRSTECPRTKRSTSRSDSPSLMIRRIRARTALGTFIPLYPFCYFVPGFLPQFLIADHVPKKPGKGSSVSLQQVHFC